MSLKSLLHSATAVVLTMLVAFFNAPEAHATFIVPSAEAQSTNGSELLADTQSAIRSEPSHGVPAYLETHFDADATKQVIKTALAAFHTPGMAVGLVHKGEIVFLEGVGLRNIAKKSNVNPDTYFRLASTSKAFTAAAIGILVDQGKLSWKDKVTQHLPEFQMQDAWVTREFTINDLLVHHSGLTGGAGDSMIWPEPSGFSRAEVVANLRYLSPESSFRSEYAYSNVLYITAGEIVARVSGQSYADFVQQSIFNPLDMKCYAGDVSSKALKNSAMSYSHNDEAGIYTVPRNRVQKEQQMSVAAGGIVCNARSMSKWLKALLAPETLPFSGDVLNAMWSPQTILTISDSEEEWDGTLFKTYGYGWRIADMLGYKLVSHTGTLAGYQAYVALLPELDVGVVILNNGSNYGARSSVMQHILKSFIPSEKLPADSPNDWVKAFIDLQAEQEAKYLANFNPVPEGSEAMQVSNSQLIGTYQDTWFGKMKIFQQASTLRLESERMLTLKGTVKPYAGNRFKVEWDNSNAASDAFLIIQSNLKNEVTGMTMHPFVVEEKQRHEYRDMNFVKL